MKNVNISKQQQYNKLVQEVASCVACDEYKLKKKNGEIIELTHDKDRKHINLWANWQGSIDADILLIGQDWGRLLNDQEAKRWANKNPYMSLDKKDKDYSLTDTNLRKLFMETFGIDISTPDIHLFFTNSIQCYKTGSLSNKTSEQWYKLCNRNYIDRLIKIIKPKLIITVGKHALNGLQSCGIFYNIESEILLDSDTFFKQKFCDIVDNGLLKLKMESGFSVKVFPAFHCGVMACNLNRSFEKQLKDWEKIKGIL